MIAIMFNGRLKTTVIEAKGLQHTSFQTRHQMAESLKPVPLNPYITTDVDNLTIERTSTKAKTHDPTWNETFTTDLLRNAEEAGFTVFHDATIPPDEFVANCKISLSELIEKEEQPIHDLWIDLEPTGKLHVKIELQWATQEEQAQPIRQFKEKVPIIMA